MLLGQEEEEADQLKGKGLDQAGGEEEMEDGTVGSGHTKAVAGHPDVAEEGEEVDEEVQGEVYHGHVH